MNIDEIKPLYDTIIHKVKDPPRYPKVINGYEDQMRESYQLEMNKMTVDVTKKMVEFLK